MTALLASGFPFQTSITELVRSVPGCCVLQEEFPWQDAMDSGFLDLVVQKHNFIVAIECKKTSKEILTFLQPNTTEKVVMSRCIYLTQIHDQSMRLELYCTDWEIKPHSLESMFCVVSTSDSGKDHRLLENDARLLIRGADAFGRWTKASAKPKALDQPDRTIIPILVTNAKLFAAKYEPSDVSLESGQLPEAPPPDISPIEWVRFRKAFTADAGCDRTVFVVAANSLQKFLLHELDHISTTPSTRGIFVP
jgi:hypothetical protein